MDRTSSRPLVRTLDFLLHKKHLHPEVEKHNSCNLALSRMKVLAAFNTATSSTGEVEEEAKFISTSLLIIKLQDLPKYAGTA